MSTIAFTVCFAVWTIFSIIGVQIKDELGLTETAVRPADRHADPDRLARPHRARHLDRPLRRPARLHGDDAGGGARDLPARLRADLHRRCCLPRSASGLAGGSFAVGVAYVSRFYPAGKQGTALGIFGVGNVGAAVTKFVAPFVLLAWGWQSVALIWAAALAVMAVVFWFTTEDDPVIRERRVSARRAAAQLPRASSRRSRTSASGASRSTTSSPSAPSWRWRSGCRAT